MSVRLINDKRFGVFSSANYDGLLDHLRLKHRSTLRSVKLEGATVSKKALQSLCRHCVDLEELTVSVRHGAIVSIFFDARARDALLQYFDLSYSGICLS